MHLSHRHLYKKGQLARLYVGGLNADYRGFMERDLALRGQIRGVMLFSFPESGKYASKSVSWASSNEDGKRRGGGGWESLLLENVESTIRKVRRERWAVLDIFDFPHYRMFQTSSSSNHSIHTYDYL